MGHNLAFSLLFLVCYCWTSTRIHVVGAVNNDVYPPNRSPDQVFLTPDLNGPPPSSDEDLPISHVADEPQRQPALSEGSRHRTQAALKIQHLTPRVEARRNRQREQKAIRWRTMPVEDRKKIASIKNAKRSERYRNLPEEKKEEERIKSRQKQKKHHDKDPAKFNAYQRKYRKDNPEKTRVWEQKRREKRKVLRAEKKNKRTTKEA